MNLSRLILLAVALVGLHVASGFAADPIPPEYLLDDTENVEPSRQGFTGGVGLYLLQPFFESNPAYSIEVENQNPPRGTPTFHKVDRVDISHRVTASPLVWLGYLDDTGFGGRARYWYFRAGTNQEVGLPPSRGPALATVFSATPLGLQAFGDTLFQPNSNGPGVVEPTAVAITSKLELQVGDLEALQEVQAGRWDFLFSGGIRFARIAQSYNFYNLQPTAAPLVLRTLVSEYDFNGAGPVLAVEARRPFAESGLCLYGNVRGALLYGSAEQNGSFSGTRLRNNDANPQLASEQRNRALPVGELEVGVEYSREVGTSRWFGQLGLIGQEWFGAGNASRSAVHAFPEGPTIGGYPIDSNLAFLGLALRLGVMY